MYSLTQAVLEDLECMKPYIVKAEEIAKNVTAHGIDDPAEGILLTFSIILILLSMIFWGCCFFWS